MQTTGIAKRRVLGGVAAAVLCGLGLAAQGQEKTSSAQATIKVDRSSTVFPITEAVAEEFQASHKGTRVTVGISGTGGGFKKFVRGEIDVADASRPILAKEMEEAKKNGVVYIELPVAFDALTVMVNPKNDWVKDITIADLKKIWAPEAQGQVMKWNQVRPEWPDRRDVSEMFDFRSAEYDHAPPRSDDDK